MKLVTEYHEPIPNECCGATADFMRLEARLVACIIPGDGFARSELEFRIEENSYFRMKTKGNMFSMKYGPWAVLGHHTWSSTSNLPRNVSLREFYTFMNLLSVGNPNAGSTIMDFFHELEVVPAFEDGNGESWIKDALPKWYHYLMKNEKTIRDHDVRKVMES